AVLASLARIRIALDQPAALRETLDAIAAAQPAELDGLLAHITDDARAWTAPDAAALLARWLALVRSKTPAPGPKLAAALALADAAAIDLASAADVRQRLIEAV